MLREAGSAQAREWAQLIRIEQRVLVYYPRSVVRELDRATQRSTAGPLAYGLCVRRKL
ncbi:MAG TPA: hypothetical protein VFW94_15990 [Candidatus Acidoferrales bacterium]|nr:hypothetical protein [Candidatus Acidoferrales bacterium]